MSRSQPKGKTGKDDKKGKDGPSEEDNLDKKVYKKRGI
jgi:hypothetical protein